MADTHVNRLRCTVSAVASSGLGAFTISAASSGYRAFGSGQDGQTFTVVITEGTTWEVNTGCTYTHSGTSLARGTLADSSTGSAITFTDAAIVTEVASAAFGNRAERLLDVLGDTEIAVTGTTTATLDRMHHCTGTSANYTVTLPAASGNAGRRIGFRMGSATGLTKLVTIDGNSAETIDGATTRIMWSGETAILLCDGSNWFKIAGKSIPFSAGMYLAATQSGFTNNAVVKVNIDTVDFDASGVMADTTNKRINIPRTSLYTSIGKASRAGATNGTAMARWLTLFYLSGNQVGGAETSGSTGSYPAPIAARTQSMTAGDYLELRQYQDSGISQSVFSSSAKEAQMTIVEVPQW